VIDRLENAVVVPAASVVESDSGTIVHVVDAQGKVAVRRVVAGRALDGLRVITRGLDSGASVIVDGLQRIRPGLSVKTEPAVLTRRDPEGTRITAADAVAPPKL
jgi:membrane fusion protein (multidrug efflux system)